MGRSWDTGVCSVTWPLNGSEAGDDLVLIKTSSLVSFPRQKPRGLYQSKVGLAKTRDRSSRVRVKGKGESQG